MRNRAYRFLIVGAVFTCQALFPFVSLGNEAGDPEQGAGYAGENRWVPSLAITSGVTIQEHRGSASSDLHPGLSQSDNPPPLRCPDPPNCMFSATDNAVTPFVGASLEVMTPALSVRTRPRFFLGGEILAAFATTRGLAFEGNPDCIRSPLPNSPCAREQTEPESKSFGEVDANGGGTRTEAQVDTLVFGASLGVAFPVRAWNRQFLIKPSFGWIHYKIDAEGLVVDGACDPVDQCTDIINLLKPNDPPTKGFLRETTLMTSASRRFNGIGGGLDIEMDTGRLGPFGVSLYLGGRAYYTLGDRTITFGAAESIEDQLGANVSVASFKVEIAPMLYRAHLGIRFLWLGSPEK